MSLAQETAAAYAAFAAGNYVEAGERAQRILLQAPSDGGALTLIGRLALVAGEADVAHDVFSSLLERHPTNSSVWVDLAMALRDLNQHIEAREVLQRAVSLDAQNWNHWVRLGEVHLSLNEVAEAAQAFRRALDLNPQGVPAFRGLAQVELLDPESTLVGRFANLASSNTLTTHERAHLHYALAQIYRRTGANTLFMQHLLAANAQQRSLSRGNARREYAEMFDRLEAVFTKETLQRLPRVDPIKPTPLFILGMPRSGTTLVERLLAAHPQVKAAGEIDYMRRSLRRGIENRTHRTFPEGIEALQLSSLNELAHGFARRLQLVGKGSAYVTDKTPGNYHLLGLLRVLFPQGPIIHVQRDPMDTCFSILQYPFEDRSPHTCDISLLAYSYARYVRLMKRWEELFGDEFITVRYEDLVSEPMQQGRRLYRHCGLDWIDDHLGTTGGAVPVRTFSALQVRKPIYKSSVGAWRDYAVELEPLRVALERELTAI